MRRCWPASVLMLSVVAVLLVPGMVRAAEEQNVAIASFRYTPDVIQVNAGDTVSWTNLDPTVHTVTADQGAFISGSIHQGQTYSLTFNKPGGYAYFCEPHEEMRGRVLVIGAAAPPEPAPVTPPTTVPRRDDVAIPTTTMTTVTSSSAAVPPPAASAPVTTPVLGASVAVAEAAPAAPQLVAAGAVVSGGVVTGVRRGLPPLLTALALLLVAGAATLLLAASGLLASTAARAVAAALTIGTAVFHLQLHYVLPYPEPIGSLMLMQAAAAALLAAYLLASPWSRSMLVAGVGFHVASIAAFALARAGPGLFGYHELGWYPSPQAAGAVAAEAAAILLLLYAGLASVTSTTNHSASSGAIAGGRPALPYA